MSKWLTIFLVKREKREGYYEKATESEGEKGREKKKEERKKRKREEGSLWAICEGFGSVPSFFSSLFFLHFGCQGWRIM